MKFEIKNRWTDSVIFTFETESIKLCVEEAVKSGANLYGANLDGAYLRGANLYGANLDGAKYGEDVPMENEPLQLLGTRYFVLVMATHIKIGCKLYKHTEWESFTDAEISLMDSAALEWWKEWKEFVLSLSFGHQQRIASKREKK